MPPNTRVQRTRSSPWALREPLTRHPLGGLVRSLVALAAVVFVCTCSCASAPSSAFTGFGAVDPKSPPVPADRLKRVNTDLTVGDIFSILGPAHGYEPAGIAGFDSVSCPAGSRCWEWDFTDGLRLAIPVESDPQAKPRAFRVYQVDYAKAA